MGRERKLEEDKIKMKMFSLYRENIEHLKELCRITGMSQSAYIRFMIELEYRRLAANSRASK